MARTPQFDHMRPASGLVNPLDPTLRHAHVSSEHRFYDDPVCWVRYIVLPYLVLRKFRVTDKRQDGHANLRVVVLVVAFHDCGWDVTGNFLIADCSVRVLGKLIAQFGFWD
jgi:hypothetical protein